MSSQWADDDDDLVAALQEAFRAEQEVPREFIEVGQAAYTWRSIDAELAALTFDSATELAAAAAPVRSAEASPRFLTFSSAELTIELEIGPDGIIGQIVPPQPGRAEARPASGPVWIPRSTTSAASWSGRCPARRSGCIARPVPGSAQ